jgi:hypothetical protein
MEAYLETRGSGASGTGRDETLVVGVFQDIGGILVARNQVEESPVAGFGGLRHGGESGKALDVRSVGSQGDGGSSRCDLFTDR